MCFLKIYIFFLNILGFSEDFLAYGSYSASETAFKIVHIGFHYYYLFVHSYGHGF